MAPSAPLNLRPNLLPNLSPDLLPNLWEQKRSNTIRFLCCLDCFLRFWGSSSPFLGSKNQNLDPEKKLPQPEERKKQKTLKFSKKLIPVKASLKRTDLKLSPQILSTKSAYVFPFGGVRWGLNIFSMSCKPAVTHVTK